MTASAADLHKLGSRVTRLLLVLAFLQLLSFAGQLYLRDENGNRVDDIAVVATQASRAAVQANAAARNAQQAVDAICDVVAVQLENRANSKQTIKLFEPIRQQNPEQFDRLVERARAGDERLAKAQAKLPCDVN